MVHELDHHVLGLVDFLGTVRRPVHRQDSRGRTIREFVVCVLLIPTVFNLLWMTVFGNGAIWMDAQTAGMLTQAAAETDRLLFLFLNQLPLLPSLRWPPSWSSPIFFIR